MGRSCSALQDLLRYSVLTASTVGPGTIVLCSKAGADYREQLLWCVLISSIVAASLQEGAGRLSVLTDHTLGSVVRKLGDRGWSVAARYAFAVTYGLGCLAYQANNFSGTMAAFELVISNSVLRYTVNLAMGPLVVGLICAGSTDQISMLMSLAVLAMLMCFIGAICLTGVDPGIASGTVPYLPEGSSKIALGLIGTTSIHANLILGSSLAIGGSLRTMRRGIIFASALTAAVSARRKREHMRYSLPHSFSR
jgi:Mn2+/Fe2+ NRAMP family transporter|tara:strand:- start:319 stop:1074 length:756 start_codon:yes stop_codon:yes gene_type:complete